MYVLSPNAEESELQNPSVFSSLNFTLGSLATEWVHTRAYTNSSPDSEGQFQAGQYFYEHWDYFNSQL